MDIRNILSKLLGKGKYPDKSKWTVQGRLLKSFLLVLLSMFVINLFLYYFNVGQIYRGQIEKYNNNIVERITRTYELYIDNAQELVYRLAYNDQEFIQILQNQEDGPELKEKLMNKVNPILAASEYYTSAYIYIKNKGYVLTSNLGSTPINDFYDVYPIRRAETKNIVICEPRISSGPGLPSNFISFSCKIPLHQNSYDGILVINIDANKLYGRILQSFNLDENSSLYITDRSGKVLIAKENDFLGKNICDLKHWGMPLDELQDNDSFQRGENLISTYYSSKTGLSFILDLSLKNKSNMTEHFISYVNISVFFVIMAIMIIYIISSMMLRPLGNIIARVRTNDMSNTKGIGELESIGRYLDGIEHEKDKLKEQLEETMPIYREKVLQDILTSSLYSLDEIRNKLSYFNIDIGLRNYIVATLMMDLSGMDEHRIGLIKLSVRNIALSIFTQNFKAFTIEAQKDKISIAVNILEDNHSSDEYEIVVACAEKTISIIREEVKENVIVGIGSFVEGIEDLWRSHQESLEALNYKKISKSNIISIYHIKKFNEHIFVYPYDKEKQLLNFIKIGYYVESCKCLEEIFDQLKAYRYMDDQEVEYFVLQLLNSLNRIIYENQIKMDQSSFVQNFLILKKNSSLEAIEEVLKAFVGKIIDKVNSSRRNPEEGTIGNIIKYINEHYMENLQLTELADRFDLNRFYIGQLFKQHTGKSFNDYTSEKKVEKAKELLITTEMSVKSVSEVLGFSYSDYFIKIFKKLEGITPGEYRVLKNSKNFSVES